MVTAYNDTPPDVTNRIRAVRKALGLTLEDLAARTGISWQTIQRYETGVRKVKVETLGQIADALGVPSAELMTDAVALSAEERDLIAWLREHPRDRQLILSQLRVLREDRESATKSG